MSTHPPSTNKQRPRKAAGQVFTLLNSALNISHSRRLLPHLVEVPLTAHDAVRQLYQLVMDAAVLLQRSMQVQARVRPRGERSPQGLSILKPLLEFELAVVVNYHLVLALTSSGSLELCRCLALRHDCCANLPNSLLHDNEASGALSLESRQPILGSHNTAVSTGDGSAVCNSISEVRLGQAIQLNDIVKRLLGAGGRNASVRVVNVHVVHSNLGVGAQSLQTLGLSNAEEGRGKGRGGIKRTSIVG
jgi:hypothetical protein